MSLMPLKSKNEKEYVDAYISNVNEFCDDFENVTYNDIIENFDEPKDVVIEYLKKSDGNYLIKNIGTRNIIKRTMTIIVLIIFCLTMFIAFLFYKGYNDAKDSYISREEIIIEE